MPGTLATQADRGPVPKGNKTPADVHYGRAGEVLAARPAVMDEIFARTPERFITGQRATE